MNVCGAVDTQRLPNVCGFADGFVGIVASLILSKGSQMVNAQFDGSQIW